MPDVTPTSTGSCGASRSHGAPARCGRPIGLARDHADTGAPAGAVRDGLAPNRPVAGDRAASDLEGALRPPPPGTARGVLPRPASGLAAPRPRPAASGRPSSPSSPIRRHHPRTPSGRQSQSTRGTRDRGGRDRARPGMPERLHRPVAPAATISVLGVPMRRRVTARTGRKGGNARQGGSTVASVGAVHDVAARRWDAREALAGLSWEFAYIVPTQPQLSIPPTPVSCCFYWSRRADSNR